ncbi:MULTISPECIES: ABC transporter permease [unclassified Leifsonia]|uniref:ABC transporter permease n=1 Tax=unclassified Leifsonia TaxID=2663824 RepID=UPI0006F4B65A|nr:MULTISPECIES: ABC transporter permease [unclassified Leifsonia]KQX07316.1 hypothetical protein ASC59_05920 [Leifsonia sp. Root1293]KRA11599.1 hypothetical protein ASD61_05920 [Leifsonia sp. Root60]
MTSTKAADDDLLSPNTLIGDSERMPIAELERIRAIDGVDVAAPISQLVVPSIDSTRLDFAAPVDESKTTLDPQQYRLRVQYLTDDGLGERLALSKIYRLTLDTSNAPREIPVDRSAYDDQGCTTEIDGISVDCSYVYPATEMRYTAMIQDESPTDALVDMGAGSSVSSTVIDGKVVFQLPGVALPPTRITLVDPVAEQELLGDGGAFLDPLVSVGAGSQHEIDELAEWSAQRPEDEFSGIIDKALEQQQASIAGWRSSGEYQEYVSKKKELGQEPRPPEEIFPPARYVPVLVAPVKDVPLSLRVDVEGMGPGELPDVASAYWVDPSLDDAGVAGVPLGTIRADVRSLLDPFSTHALVLPWLGESDAVPVPGEQGYAGAYLGQAARSTMTAPTKKNGVRTLEPTGYLGTSMEIYWGGDPSYWIQKGPGTTPGAQSTYATVAAEQLQQTGDSGGTFMLPIADFDADAIALPDDPLSYVPLGAYDPAKTSLVADATGGEIDPVDLLPAAGGLGLVGARTSAIADIGALSESLNDRDVDAVRVRVSGVERYDRDGVAKVGAVADEIEKLGLAATIVAGSSPQTVKLAVDGYAFGTTDADGEQSVGPLGTVEQHWSALGAAARLGTSVSAATLSLLATVIAATLALFAVASLSSARTRRSEAATLRAVGWPRRRIVRWRLAEQWPVLAALLLAGGVAVLLAADDALVLSTTASVLMAVVVIAVIRAVAGSSGERMRLATPDELLRERPQERPEVRWTNAPAHDEYDGYGLPDESMPDEPIVPAARRPRRRMRLGAESLAGFGLRLVRGDAGVALGNAAAVLIVIATTACFVLSLGLGRTGAGASLVGAFGSAQVLAPQLALGLVGVGAGVLLTILLRRQALQGRARSRAVLRELGWVGSDIRRAERSEVLVVGLPAALLGCYVLWFVLDTAGLAGIDTAVSAALIAGLAVVALLILATRKAATAP